MGLYPFRKNPGYRTAGAIWFKIQNLKLAAKTFAWLEERGIDNYADLESRWAPVYKGYIYYEDIGAVLVCGEILPYEIFQLFTDMPEVKKLYIFPCLSREQDAQPAYYSFEPMESAREEMKKYIDHKFEEMCQVINKKNKGINIIPA